jgi:pimeloyl-ACP methyl ester carboxylesterase
MIRDKSRTIVLLHAYPLDRTMWFEQIDFLSAHNCRVIAPNLLANASESSLPPVTIESMAQGVGASMDALGIDHATICGLSMGGYVAFEFMRLFPARVRGLVLAGARAEGPDENEKEMRKTQASQIVREGMNFVADNMLPKLLAPRTFTAKPEVVARVREIILRSDARAAAAAQHAMGARVDYSAILSGIAVGTLIIAGSEDAVRKPDDARFIQREIPNSQLEIIEQAGHLMNMEQPRTFNDILLDFLNSLD